LAFNNFRALKRKFGGDIRFCHLPRSRRSQSDSSKRENQMVMGNTSGKVPGNHVQASHREAIIELLVLTVLILITLALLVDCFVELQQQL
jgi:hypothetical protein